MPQISGLSEWCPTNELIQIILKSQIRFKTIQSAWVCGGINAGPETKLSFALCCFQMNWGSAVKLLIFLFPLHDINLHCPIGNNKQKRVHLYGLVYIYLGALEKHTHICKLNIFSRSVSFTASSFSDFPMGLALRPCRFSIWCLSVVTLRCKVRSENRFFKLICFLVFLLGKAGLQKSQNA